MADINWKKSDPFHGTEIPALLPVVVTAAFILAAWYFYTNRSGPAAGQEAFVVKPEYYDTTPVRAVRKRLETEGMACGDCHDPAAGPSAGDPTAAPEVHAGKVTLKHGANKRCFNCHNNAKRDFFAADGGGQIPYSKVETLCRRCHGTTYRDWTNGVHGRRNGYWDKSAGTQTPLACIACHNPHDPKFKPMSAAPPPRKPGVHGVKH